MTSSSDVALYFASSKYDEVAGIVYSYRVNPDMRVSIGEQPDGREPDWYELTDRCRGGRPLLVKPRGYEPRIVVQHGGVRHDVARRLAGGTQPFHVSDG